MQVMCTAPLPPTQEQCAQYWPGNSEGLFQVGAYMMQVETEVEKESGLVLREVNLTNLKVRAPSALEHTHASHIVVL